LSTCGKRVAKYAHTYIRRYTHSRHKVGGRKKDKKRGRGRKEKRKRGGRGKEKKERNKKEKGKNEKRKQVHQSGKQSASRPQPPETLPLPSTCLVCTFAAPHALRLEHALTFLLFFWGCAHEAWEQ